MSKYISFWNIGIISAFFFTTTYATTHVTHDNEVQTAIHTLQLQFGTETESWAKVCNQVKDLNPPVADQARQFISPKCDSRSFYYGMGKPIDYVKARTCAYAERKSGSDETDNFSGSAILMMIYANGYGVKKNIALAERFACVIPASEAEMEGRIKHLENLKNTSKQTSAFDLCDDITSGFMMGECAILGDDLNKPEREQKLAAIQKNWNQREKSAFQRLKNAANHFTKIRSEEEIDLSGTARTVFLIGEANIQQRDFTESLKLLELNQAPHYSLAQFKDADQKLNFLFQKLIHGNTLPQGTITQESVQKTQKAWIQYRDAWLAFAKIKYSQYSSESIAAWFTKKRNHMLDSLLN